MEQAYLLSEDQAIVEMSVDIPFKVRGRQTRIVPAEWAERVTKEFQSLGEVAPENLHPTRAEAISEAEHEFLP
jgi:hypothetical protein